VPADQHPHCAWTVVIDPDVPESPAPEQALLIETSRAAQLPTASFVGAADDGENDYRGPLDPDLQLGRFSSATLRGIVDEVCLQGHLLALSFGSAVARRLGDAEAVSALNKQFTGVAGVASERISRTFGLGDSSQDLATAFDLHPAFHPRIYVDWRVEVDGETVILELGDCPALEERGFVSWITVLAQGGDRALSAIASGVDPHWSVTRLGPKRWSVERLDQSAREFDEVMLTKFSAGARFAFAR
jgi:hypothetical protein